MSVFKTILHFKELRETTLNSSKFSNSLGQVENRILLKKKNLFLRNKAQTWILQEKKILNINVNFQIHCQSSLLFALLESWGKYFLQMPEGTAAKI